MKNNSTIDFAKIALIHQKADETIENILSKQFNNFDQYAEVSKIDDLDVAKLVIKRLLDKLNDTNKPSRL